MVKTYGGQVKTCINRMIKIDTKIILIALLIVCILLSINLCILLTTEHYKIERYEIESIAGHRIYFDGGNIFINRFFSPIEYDLKNLSKGDDISIHYIESIIGGRTYIKIEKNPELTR